MARSTEYKYTVDDVAKARNIEAAAVRIKLRNEGVKKNEDNTYGWNSQAEFKKILALWDKEPASKGKKAAPKKKTASKKKAVAKVKPRAKANGAEHHAEA